MVPVLVRIFLFLFAGLAVALSAVNASAMPIKSSTIKNDLKMKTISLTKGDFDTCGAALVRRAQTMNYSCTLPIPVQARVSQLQNMTTPRIFNTSFGGLNREVHVEVSADAKQLTLSTSFDATGIDFEISKFNDDFFAVYAQAAQLIISEALKKRQIKIEVLESL